MFFPGIVSYSNPSQLSYAVHSVEEMEEMHLRDLEEEEMLQQKMQKPQSQRNTTVTWVKMEEPYPIGSMYGVFTYIYHKNQPNVGVYTIHGSYGYIQRM